MDIKMPGMSGYEATELIKKQIPTLPIIAQMLIGDKDASVRLEAAKFFTREHNETSRVFLNTALKDQGKQNRTLAQQALTNN